MVCTDKFQDDFLHYYNVSTLSFQNLLPSQPSDNAAICWHRNDSSLLRNAKRGSFKPRNINKGTSSYQLRQFAEATLGSGSLQKAVRLPEGEDVSEWLAVNGRFIRSHLRNLLTPIKLLTFIIRLTSFMDQSQNFVHRNPVPR